MVVYFQDLQRLPMRSEQSIGAQLASDRHEIESKHPQIEPSQLCHSSQRKAVDASGHDKIDINRLWGWGAFEDLKRKTFLSKAKPLEYARIAANKLPGCRGKRLGEETKRG
jgi:hypothetical protein